MTGVQTCALPICPVCSVHSSVKLKPCVWLAGASCVQRGREGLRREVDDGEQYPEGVVPAPGRPELVPLPQEGGRLLRGRALAAAYLRLRQGAPAAAAGEAGHHRRGRLQLNPHDTRRRLPGRGFVGGSVNVGFSAVILVHGRGRGPQSLPFRRAGAADALLIDRSTSLVTWFSRRGWTVYFCEINEDTTYILRNLVYMLRGP